MPYAPPTFSLAMLKRVHPQWMKNRDKWCLLRDVTSGELDANQAKYVPRAQFEDESLYQARLKLTKFAAECVPARNRLVGALLSQRATRDGITSATLRDWIDQNVDRSGLGLDSFIEAVALPMAFDFGAAHVLVDRLNDGGPPPESLADQKSRGMFLPYLCAFTPLEVRNWSVGVDGKLDFALIVEECYEAMTPGGARVPTRYYRWFDRTGWAVVRTVTPEGKPFLEDGWDPASGEWIDRGDATRTERIDKTTSGEHGSPGTVPLVSLIPEPICDLVGRSITEPAALLDLQTLILTSDLNWDLYIHAHPTLVVKTTRDLKEVGVGSNQFIKLNPSDGEDAGYATLNSESFQARERAIERSRQGIYKHLGIDPLGVTEDAPAQASGVARAWSFETTEGRQLGRIADRVEEWEFRLESVVAKFIGEEPPKKGSVRWPDTFESASAVTLTEQSIALPNALQSRTADKAFQKRLARALLGDQRRETFDTIDHEIDAAAERRSIAASNPFAQGP